MHPGVHGHVRVGVGDHQVKVRPDEDHGRARVEGEDLDSRDGLDDVAARDGQDALHAGDLGDLGVNDADVVEAFRKLGGLGACLIRQRLAARQCHQNQRGRDGQRQESFAHVRSFSPGMVMCSGYFPGYIQNVGPNISLSHRNQKVNFNCSRKNGLTAA